MSLRQRGQRPSEASNEGGYYSGGKGGQQQQPPPPAYNSAPSSGNNGAVQRTPQQQRRPSPPSSGGGGGYYGSSYNTPTATAPTNPNIPGTAAPGYAGYASTPNQQPAVQSPYAQTQTAPPAYNNQHQGSNQPSAAGMQARAIQFDAPAAPGAGGGYNRQGSGGGYGGYAIGGSAASAGGSATNLNPYKKNTSKSGFGLKHILLSLLAMTLIVLAGTTLYYRNVMKNVEIELNQAKEDIATQKTGGRHGRDKDETKKREMQKKRKDKEWKKKRDKKPKNNKPSEEARRLQIEIKKLTKELSTLQSKQRDLEARTISQKSILETLSARKQELLKTIDHAGYVLEDQTEETAKYKAMVDGMEEVEEYMKTREGALFKRIGVLESRLGEEGWREAAEWFGSGPHKVEIELEYPQVTDPNADPSTWKRIRNTLTIEMAPLDLMPHTVNLFLQQVHHQLWDGCSVRNNPKHIFQLGPSYNEEEHPDEIGEPHFDHFYQRGLDKVAYQEYNARWPHVQWSVGLAGRPGGPDLYINKIDNTMIHGPGGQTNKDDLHNEADPCFGKVVMESNDEGVVSGKQILDDIDKIPTDGERGWEIKYPVVIIGAKVLAPKENPKDGWRVIPPGKKLDQQDAIMPLPEVPHGV